MMKILKNALVLSVSIVGLAGCGGSSGGGTAPGGTNIFTSFSNLPDNGTTIFEGTSRSASFTSDDDG